MERRTFLAMAATATRSLGANDRVRIASIGAGNRGKYLIEQFKEIGAEIPAVCDVYEPNLEAGLKLASTGAKAVRDYDYSGGLLVQQGAHIIDCIQWFMNSQAPTAVTCIGNQPVIPGAEVTHTAVMACEYSGAFMATFTLSYQAMRYATYNDQVQKFHGNKARLDVGREYYQLFPESNAIEMKPSAELKKPGSFGLAAPAHIRNFLECVRSRKDPNAPVEAGRDTAIALALAMDSLRQGRRMRSNAETKSQG